MQVNQVGLSRKHILDAVDDSVARLGTYIDVLQTHRLDREVSLEETMKAFNDVIEGGKARYIGDNSVSLSSSSSSSYFGLPSLMSSPIEKTQKPNESRLILPLVCHTYKDGSLRIPNSLNHRLKPQMPQNHLDARVLQPPLPRRKNAR